MVAMDSIFGGPLRILILGKDPSLFHSFSERHIGDARTRHIFYSQRLQARYAGSEIRLLTYTPHGSDSHYQNPCQGLHLYGTESFHRATYLVSLVRKLPTVLTKGWRPDIVTVQTPWEEGVLGYFLARCLGARFIPQVHFDLFSTAWASEHCLNPLRRLIARQILRRADRVRVVSQLLREKVAVDCAISLNRIDVIPVGVNFIPASGKRSDFKARLSPLLVDRKVVLFVGRLCQQKNLKLWVNVASRVANQVPNATFVIVGDGSHRLLMREWVLASGLEERFLFLGSRMHEELPAVYAAADIFLLTSDYEGLARVVQEAMLAGLPVVSTACSGSTELIEEGRTGHILACGDAPGLAQAVSRLLADDAKAARFGASGRRRIENEFTFERLTDRLIDAWLTR